MNNKMYTAKEAARKLGMTARNVTQYWGKHVGHKRDGIWFFNEDDLSYIQHNKRGSNARDDAQSVEGDS